MARLYSNENFPRPVVERLRELGHDVLTSHESGNANQRVADEDVLTFATAQGRAVITLNRHDFIRLHRAGLTHAGVIACAADVDYPRQAERIDAAI